MRRQLFILLTGLTFIFFKGASQTPSWAISGTFTSIASDQSGNLFAVQDKTLTLYDTSAQVLWSRTYGAAIDNVSSSPDGAVYIAGRFNATIQLGTFTLTPAGTSSLYIARLNAMGEVQWARQIDQKADAAKLQLVTDSKGSVYIAWIDGSSFYIGKFTTGGILQFIKAESLGNSPYGNPVNTISVDRQDNLHVFFSSPYIYNPADPLNTINTQTRVLFDSTGKYLGRVNLKQTIREVFLGYKARSGPDDYLYTKIQRTITGYESTSLSGCSGLPVLCYEYPPINPDYDKFGGSYYAGYFYGLSYGLNCDRPPLSLKFGCSNAVTLKEVYYMETDMYVLIKDTLVSTRGSGVTDEYPIWLAADPNGQSLYILATWQRRSDTSKFYFGSSALSTPGSMVLRYRINRPSIKVDAGEDKVICLGGASGIGFANMTVEGKAPYTYSWQPAAGLSDASVPNPMASPDATTQYVVTVTDAAGAVGRDTVVVTVDSALYIPKITLTSGVNPFCDGDTIVLKASEAVSYQWSNGAATQTVNVTASGPVTLNTVNAEGCRGTALPFIATMKPRAPLPVITANGPTAFCAGGSVVLTAQSGQTDVTYQWNTGVNMPSITVSSSGLYFVKATNKEGCESEAAQQLVTVYANPTPTIKQAGNVLMVEPAAVSYQWYWNGKPLNEATGQSLSIEKGGKYAVVVTDNNGCSNTATLEAVKRNTSAGIDYQVYPNPVTSDLHIVYTLKQAQTISITVKDLQGHNVIHVLDQRIQQPGEYQYTIANVVNRLQKGIYLVVFQVGNKRIVERVLVNKK